MLILGEYYKPQRCKECDYSDICDIIEVPSEEACEAIRACAKDFLYDKIWNSLYGYFVKKED
jgi:hypothetical protein